MVFSYFFPLFYLLPGPLQSSKICFQMTLCRKKIIKIGLLIEYIQKERKTGEPYHSFQPVIHLLSPNFSQKN